MPTRPAPAARRKRLTQIADNAATADQAARTIRNDIPWLIRELEDAHAALDRVIALCNERDRHNPYRVLRTTEVRDAIHSPTTATNTAPTREA